MDDAINNTSILIALIQISIVFAIVMLLTHKSRKTSRKAKQELRKATKKEQCEQRKERARVRSYNRARSRYKTMQFNLHKPKEFRKWEALIVSRKLKSKYEKKLSPADEIMESYMANISTMNAMQEISRNFQYMHELFKKIKINEMKHKAPVYGLILGRMVCLDGRLENLCTRSLLYNELETLTLAQEDRRNIDSEILVLLFESRKLCETLQNIVVQQPIASQPVNPHTYSDFIPPKHNYYTA